MDLPGTSQIRYPGRKGQWKIIFRPRSHQKIGNDLNPSYLKGACWADLDGQQPTWDNFCTQIFMWHPVGPSRRETTPTGGSFMITAMPHETQNLWIPACWIPQLRTYHLSNEPDSSHPLIGTLRLTWKMDTANYLFIRPTSTPKFIQNWCKAFRHHFQKRVT